MNSDTPLEQFVPLELCAKCDVCCRFLDEETPLAPVGLPLISHKDRFICRNFDPAKNKCTDYENRPLDCRIYPLLLMWDEEHKNVVLGIDHKCPYVKKFQIPNPKSQINSKFQIPNHILKNIDPKYIVRFQDDVEILEKVDAKVAPAFNKLLIGDKALFEKYANHRPRPLSTCSFIANYVWAELLNYLWVIIDGNFCLFCGTGEALFMPIPPLGEKLSAMAIKKCFELMNKVNKNKNCSRVEDVSEKEAGFYKNLGYKVKEKGQEYIYKLEDLAKLAGDRYKGKRALCNYFEKNYKYECKEFRSDDKKACLELYKRWAADKGTVLNENCPLSDGDYYKALIEDSYAAHKKAMDRFVDLGLAGRVVLVDNKVSAYTFGYPLGDETFVVLFEIADSKIKGLSQFIFREFVKEMSDYRYINAMDDSGLENLRKVKMSYHPVKVERTYCVHA